MIVGVYALKDSLSGYSDVKLIPNDMIAMRDFRFMCSDSNAYIHFNKNDYSIVKLADFDTESGDLIVSEPEVIMRGDNIGVQE